MGTLLRIGWINLRRDRVVQALTFALPIIFFSIFAVVFGSQRTTTRRVPVVVVDEDGSDRSMRLVTALSAESALAVRTNADAGGGASAVLDRVTAEGLVKNGTVPVAIVLPKGLGGGSSAVQLLADVSDPVAPQMVQGLLQKASVAPLAGATGSHPMSFGVPTEIVNVMQPGRGTTASISFSAAGIGVMFLLFSCAGAAGTLLDEQDSGTLGRLVGSRVGMNGVLAGKWLFLVLTGMAQMTLMFLWGAIAFHLPLGSHIPGFFVMTTLTAAVASAFGLFLATLAKSRQQLAGMSTILIMTMSAFGGSMFPRFLMSETMQKIGLLTFNAWALDGYVKVFWRSAPLVELWPQLLALASMGAAFMAVARRLARRWETV